MDKQSFMEMAIGDLTGKAPAPIATPMKESRIITSKEEFAAGALADLKGGANVNKTVPVDELKNAFARSMVETAAPKKESAEIIESFKEECASEAKQTLNKLLKSLR